MFRRAPEQEVIVESFIGAFYLGLNHKALPGQHKTKTITVENGKAIHPIQTASGRQQSNLETSRKLKPKVRDVPAAPTKMGTPHTACANANLV